MKVDVIKSRYHFDSTGSGCAVQESTWSSVQTSLADASPNAEVSIPQSLITNEKRRFDFVVTAVDSDSNFTTRWRVARKNSYIYSPVPLFPRDGEVVPDSTNVRLQLGDYHSSHNQTFTLYREDPTYGDLVEWTGIGSDSVTIPASALLPGTGYKWDVGGVDKSEFFTGGPPVPLANVESPGMNRNPPPRYYQDETVPIVISKPNDGLPYEVQFVLNDISVPNYHVVLDTGYLPVTGAAIGSIRVADLRVGQRYLWTAWLRRADTKQGGDRTDRTGNYFDVAAGTRVLPPVQPPPVPPNCLTSNMCWDPALEDSPGSNGVQMTLGPIDPIGSQDGEPIAYAAGTPRRGCRTTNGKDFQLNGYGYMRIRFCWNRDKNKAVYDANSDFWEVGYIFNRPAAMAGYHWEWSKNKSVEAISQSGHPNWATRVSVTGIYHHKCIPGIRFIIGCSDQTRYKFVTTAYASGLATADLFKF